MGRARLHPHSPPQVPSYSLYLRARPLLICIDFDEYLLAMVTRASGATLTTAQLMVLAAMVDQRKSPSADRAASGAYACSWRVCAYIEFDLACVSRYDSAYAVGGSTL